MVLQDIALVQIYIHLRTGKEVRIDPEQFSDPINLVKLNQAKMYVVHWFQENNVQIFQF